MAVSGAYPQAFIRAQKHRSRQISQLQDLAKVPAARQLLEH